MCEYTQVSATFPIDLRGVQAKLTCCDLLSDTVPLRALSLAGSELVSRLQEDGEEVSTERHACRMEVSCALRIFLHFMPHKQKIKNKGTSD